MHQDQEVFTITYIADGDNSKLLLSTSETPAKEDSEASGVIYREDLPEQFDEIVSKIPVFKDAEDGSEESITHTVEEFQDLYELDLINIIEKGEEILHVDLDDDENEEGSEDHEVDIFKGDDADLAYPDTTGPDPFAIYGDDEPPSKNDAMSHIDPREAFDQY